MPDTRPIYLCDFHHPEQNLCSAGRRRQRPEAEFAEQFACAYQERFSRVHAGTKKQRTLFVREMPVAGNGIADLIVLNWNQDLVPDGNVFADLKQANPTVRAFEVKLSNWRGGLMQAHRYKYFSHVAALVVPRHKLKAAEAHMDLFQTLRVGLWGFDPESRSIADLYTPRPKQQQIAKYGAKVLSLAARAVL